MIDEQMRVEPMRIDDLRPYERNAKVHTPEQVRMIANSIEEFGFNNPVLVDDDGGIIAGHGRVEAARLLGMEEVPCVRITNLTEEQKRAYILADNRLAELSGWDESMLDLELLNIDGLDMTDFGFEGFEDEEPEEKAEAEKKPREIESMELKAFEHWDYIVFVFDNQMDWMNACEEFGIHKVDAGYGDTRKIGVGRVVRGTELLARLGNQAADSEQGA